MVTDGKRCKGVPEPSAEHHSLQAQEQLPEASDFNTSVTSPNLSVHQRYGHRCGHSPFTEGNEHWATQQLVFSLPDHFRLGPDVTEVLWKLLILTASLGSCAFLIYLWRTVLAIKPRQYGVTLDQIKKKIDDLKKENRDLEKNIASWEEKIREAKKQAEMKREQREKLSLAEVNKLKENIKNVEEINENLKDILHCKQALLQVVREKDIKNVDVVQDELDDRELRALAPKNQEMEEYEKFLEDQYNALRSQKTAKEAELNLLKKKVDMVVEFTERQKLTAEDRHHEQTSLSAAQQTNIFNITRRHSNLGHQVCWEDKWQKFRTLSPGQWIYLSHLRKLKETIYELNATKNELLAAEANLKVTKEEMDKYRQQVEEMQDQLLEAEFTFKHQIAVQERKAAANWMKARDWERRIVQQRRENAYLEYRLRMMEGEMLPVGSMWHGPMRARPELEKPLWQAPRPVPRMNSSTDPRKDPEMAMQVSTGVRVFPRCPGPLRMPYHMGPGFPPPPPPPQWWPWGPQPHLIPPPHGLPSHSEARGAQGDNSSSVPKKVPEENQANHFVV
ncbi:transport and Golgi organization protein 1 homolog [Meles meles]|uniref:transport and Golgi organization protein 1 homolog n=1 Tax=Meles meles TaxID=9662 RepID=UPI001E698C69|nr:transport and Golgi organization protein 1 homolog [Meles meles]